jgi:spermidine synthase
LNSGGLVTQWVPLYESTPDVVKSEIATFFAAFPGGTIWGNDQEGDGYDLVLLGQAGPLKVNLDELNQRVHRDPRLTQSLEEVGFRSVISLLGTYAGRAADLQPWLEHAEINRDRNLRLQYLAGLGLNGNQGIGIYEDMLAYRRFPADLFVGSSSQRVGMLRIVIEGKKPEP